MDFDIAMPLTLFFVTLASMLLSKKTESKLKSNLEEREFAMKDAVLLVAGMAVMVSIVVLVPQMAIMTLFLFSYSSLLFIVTYIFSNRRWYAAVLPPVTFIALYLLLRGTTLWSTYLINLYAVIFAIVITLYLGTLFTWKTTLVFVALLTIMDTILVLITGAMVSAATTTISLNLPVVVTLPIFPGMNGGFLLGLGDFFFAGLLATQTYKRFGKRLAVLSIVTMTASFFIFETYMLNYRPGPLPGTIMIICGWIPSALLGMRARMSTNKT